jgi:hypothetical protein
LHPHAQILIWGSFGDFCVCIQTQSNLVLIVIMHVTYVYVTFYIVHFIFHILFITFLYVTFYMLHCYVTFYMLHFYSSFYIDVSGSAEDMNCIERSRRTTAFCMKFQTNHLSTVLLQLYYTNSTENPYADVNACL